MIKSYVGEHARENYASVGIYPKGGKTILTWYFSCAICVHAAIGKYGGKILITCYFSSLPLQLSPDGETNSDGNIPRCEASRYTAISRKVDEKVHATIPKGIVGGVVFTVLQRNLRKWNERPLTCVCEC